MGDCPDSFHLSQPGWRESLDEQKFKSLILSDCVISYEDFGNCLVSPDNAEDLLQSAGGQELADHNVAELKHEILSWNSTKFDYLLWLAFGALALIEPLRDAENCRKFLRNCPRLYLMVGFEEIFFYAGTVTPNGLMFESLL